MNFLEKEVQLPVIKINYEDLKTELENKLEEYSGLVVTEDTLKACKDAQKELAGLRNKIDGYRKEKKKELEQPIKEFESQCKTLVSLIEKAEQPIKDGIKYFDDMRREEKKATAISIIEEECEKAGLNEKYASKLTVVDKYMNLTATVKEVREDVESRAAALKLEQDGEQERIDIIQSVISAENSRLRNGLKIDEFEYQISNGMNTADIIKLIRERAEKIYKIENAPKEEPKPVEEKKEEPAPAEPVTPDKEPEAQEPLYSVTYRVKGNLATLRGVSAYLKEHGITYEVIEQKAI